MNTTTVTKTAMKPILKTPYSRVDYTLDWTAWMVAGDSIADAVWMVTGGLINDGEDIDVTLKKATIWLKGGALGMKDASATCHIRTVMGREDERILWFSIVCELPINSNLNGNCGGIEPELLMATSLLASVTAFGVSTTTTTPPIVTTGAGLITINLSGLSAGTLSDSLGNTWTLAATGGTSAVSRLYYCLAPIVGSAHTFTFTGTSVFCVISVQAWSNVTAFHTATSAGAGPSASGINPGAITPAGFELFVSGYEKENGSGDIYSVDSNFTISGQQPFTSGVNYGGAFAYKITTRAEDPFWSDNHTTSGRNGGTMAAFTVPTPTVPVVAPFVQAAVGVAAASPTAVVMPNDVTAGNWLVICTGNPGGFGTPVWTDTRGLTYSLQAASINVSGGQSYCSIWTAPITSSGPQTITLAEATGGYPKVMWAIEIGPFFTGTPVVQSSSGDAADFGTTVNTSNVTSAVANNVLVAVAADSGGNPYTAVSPTAAASGVGIPGTAQGCFMVASVGAGTYSATFTKAAGGGRQSAAALLISFTVAGRSAPLPTNA